MAARGWHRAARSKGPRTGAARPAAGSGRAELLRGLRDLAASGCELHALLAHALRALQRDGIRGGCIALVNERSELFIVGYHGHIDEQVLSSRLPIGEGIMGRVAAEGRPRLVSNLERPDVSPVNRHLGTNTEMRGIAAAPIWAAGAVVGVIEVDSSVPELLNADDLQTLVEIAAAIAPAVQLAGPLKLANESLQHRVHELSVLQEAARALTASLDLDLVVSAVVRSAALGLHVPHAGLFEVGAAEARLVALHGEGRTSRPGIDLHLDRNPALREALRVRAPRRVMPGQSGDLAGLGLGHALAVPVRALDLFTGVLVAGSPHSHAFDVPQLSLLQGIAHLAELALGNAHNYRRLAEMAATDPLTRLHNRRHFERALVELHGRRFAVLAIDVDNLKAINDNCGHEAGDAALRAIAPALSGVLRDGDMVARTGGDEFAALLLDADAEEASAVAERMRNAMHGVAVAYGLARISVGCAAAAADGEPMAVWTAADDALYDAKRGGRDRVTRSGDPAGAASRRHSRWESRLTTVLERWQMRAVYQPVMRLRDGTTVGLEALARPEEIPADTGVDGLFAAAHRLGVSRDLDWLCRRAAVECAPSLPGGTALFLNVGVTALLDPMHGVDQMELLLRRGGLHVEDVVLEISERDPVHDLDRFRAVLAEYREHGFRFAIDDIGEGHANFSVTTAALPEYMKLSGTLAARSAGLGADCAIQAAVAFARGSGAQVIAEGLETGEEVARMRALGVELGQGFVLAPPRESVDFSEPAGDAVASLAGALPRVSSR